MAHAMREQRRGRVLSAARLAEIRKDAEALIATTEKSGAVAVADALITATETLPYNVRAQLAIDVAKSCLSKGKRALFESVLDELLSQDISSASDAIDDLDFALDDTEDDDTFVDVKTSNRSNTHLRHTHHHLGLTMAFLSSTVKARCLRALHDPNILMYPKAASLLCSIQRSSGSPQPVTPDLELVNLISDPRCIPRRACILMAACVKHRRTAVCDQLTAHFWKSHHHGRSATLLPSCSKDFVASFIRDNSQVMTETQFNFDAFLKAHPETSMDLLETKLNSAAPLLRASVWNQGPFHVQHSWLRPLLLHSPTAHTRLAALISAYPAFTFSPQSFDGIDSRHTFGVLYPVFPLSATSDRFSIILNLCKAKGKSSEFWSIWFPLLLDTIPTKCLPVIKQLSVHSAFDNEAVRDACERALLSLLSREDQENRVLVECLLRSHTDVEVLSFGQNSAFQEKLALAKQICCHPALSRTVYRDSGSIVPMFSDLNPEQQRAVFERILSVADVTEANSSQIYIHHVNNLNLNSAFKKVLTVGLFVYGSSWPLDLFTRLHRFFVSSLTHVATRDSAQTSLAHRRLHFDAIVNSWKECSQMLLAFGCVNNLLTNTYLQFLKRAIVHGGSSLTVNASRISNFDFFSQQLEAWSTLQDEFEPNFMAAAAAIPKELNEDIKNSWISFKKEILLSLASKKWFPQITSVGKTFEFPVVALNQGQKDALFALNQGEKKCEQNVWYAIHPEILQRLAKYILNASVSMRCTALEMCAGKQPNYSTFNFDILNVLLLHCFHCQLECLNSQDPKAKQLFESSESVIAQLGQDAYDCLSLNFEGDEFVTAAITFVNTYTWDSKLRYKLDQYTHVNYQHHFSLVTYLRPFLRRLSHFFDTHLSSDGKESICTFLRKLCDIFQEGSEIMGAEHPWLRADTYFKFFGVTIEQHLVVGLEFLFDGCKSCVIQSSSKGHLYTLAIDILSTLCYRLKPSDPLFEPVVKFAKSNLTDFSLMNQELVLCKHLPGDALNEIAWNFATNAKLSEAVREQALCCLDLNDPSKKQEILQNKCRARTFELRLRGFEILLKASIQRCHPEWGTNFVSSVQEIYQKTANESANNLNSIHNLLSTTLVALHKSLYDECKISPASLCYLPTANASDFQSTFQKIVCVNTCSNASEGSELESDDIGNDEKGNGLDKLRKNLLNFAVFSAEVLLLAFPEEDVSMPVQNWISFAMQVKYAQEAQNNGSSPHLVARSFVLNFACEDDNMRPTDNQTFHPDVGNGERANKLARILINCFIQAYETIGALYPSPESDTVQLLPHRDVSCLSLKRLFSLIVYEKPEAWMHTDVVSLLMLHWHDLDAKPNRKKVGSPKPLEGDLKVFFKYFLKHWLDSRYFRGIKDRFTPVQELDCMTTDLRNLTKSFLDTFIQSDRALTILPHWLSFYCTGAHVILAGMSSLFRKPSALPYVERILKLCPTTAYIPFVNRFMVRFAQHLIPPHFLHPEFRNESPIDGIFLPRIPRGKSFIISTKCRSRIVIRPAQKTKGEVDATPTTVLSVWMYAGRLHSSQSFRLKQQLLKTFSDSSIGNSERMRALRRATRLPSLSVYDILKTIQPEFSAPPLQVSVIGAFVSASLEFLDTSTLRVTTLWATQEAISMLPDTIDRHMAGSGPTLVSSGSYKCFVPIKIATDPCVSTVEFSAGSVSAEAVDVFVATQISSGKLSDTDLCVGVERTFDSSKSIYELYFAWSPRAEKLSDTKHDAIRTLLGALNDELTIASDAVIQQKRRVLLQSALSAKTKAVFFRRTTFRASETSEKLVRECFDANPVNLFPSMSSELSKAAIVACGYCKESTACLDTLYSPRFLSSNLSSAAVMLFERSSALFPPGCVVPFAEKLLFRNAVFFPPKVTIQKAIVRVLTSNIDESNSGIMMRLFSRCKHVSVLSLLIATCLRLLRTPTKIGLAKKLLLNILKIAVKADNQTIAAFSKFCEVSFLTIRSFLDENTDWNTPTRKELTQEWGTELEIDVDMDLLPWYMDHIIIPMSCECTNPDLRDFCIMARFCSHQAFHSFKSGQEIHSIFTIDRALIEIEAARVTYVQYISNALPKSLSSDNLDTFHRLYTVATAAKDFIVGIMESGIDEIRISCMKALTSWINTLMPSIHDGTEIRIPMCCIRGLSELASLGTCSNFVDLISDPSLSSAALEFNTAAVRVPGLDKETQTLLLFSRWKILTSLTGFDQFFSIANFWNESILEQANLNPCALPHAAESFDMYIQLYFVERQFWNVPVSSNPFQDAAKYLLELSGPLFISVSEHAILAGHVANVVSTVIGLFCHIQSDVSVSDVKFVTFHDMFVCLQPVMHSCAKPVVDWFHTQIASSNLNNLHYADAFRSALSFFHTILKLTKPTSILNDVMRSQTITGRIMAMSTIQSEIHSQFSHWALHMVESYVAKYCGLFAQDEELCNLPKWFVPVKKLGSISTLAIHAICSAQKGSSKLSNQFSCFLDWTPNTPSNLFNLQVYLRLCSKDQSFRSPGYIIEQINSLCKSSALFADEGDECTVTVPQSHIDAIRLVVASVASNYCSGSCGVLSDIIKATHTIRKEIIQKIMETASAIKTSKPLERLKMQNDFETLSGSMMHSCFLLRNVIEFLQKNGPHKVLSQFREELLLHALNLCHSASAIISFVHLCPTQLNKSLDDLIKHLKFYLDTPVLWHGDKTERLYDGMKRNPAFWSVILPLCDAGKLGTFQEDWFANRIRMQESLLGSNDHYSRMLVQSHRLEYIIISSQLLITSHCGDTDALQDPKKLPRVISALPPLFSAQFQRLWGDLFDSYENFMKEKLCTPQSSRQHLIAMISTLIALKSTHVADFLAALQDGKVQTWLETVTGVATPVSFHGRPKTVVVNCDAAQLVTEPRVLTSSLVTEPRVLTSSQVVDAVVAHMKWPESMNQKFRRIVGPPCGTRLTNWGVQDALDWMDNDLGDIEQTRAAANYMIQVVRVSPGAGAGAGQFVPLSSDIRLRPFLLSHYFSSLLLSASNPSLGVLNVSKQLLPLCAPVSALSSQREIIELLRAAFKHHRGALKSRSPVESLTEFSQALDSFQILIEPAAFCSATNVILHAKLLVCVDFITSNSGPVLTTALRSIIRSETPPPMPTTKSESLPAPGAAPPAVDLSQKEVAQIMAHTFGCFLFPLVERAKSSGVIFDETLCALFSAIDGSVTRR